MKKTKLMFGGALLALTMFFACERNISTRDKTVDEVQTSVSLSSQSIAAINCSNYTVDASIMYKDGSTYVIWQVTNPNPSNTSQDLSHWDWFLPECISFDKVLGGYYTTSYSADFSTWTSFTPTNQVDPSQSCSTANVVKFNTGTSGAASTWYAVKLQGTAYSLADGVNQGIFKAGTTCCTKDIEGVVCTTTSWCAYSQGYFFAKPNVTWCQPVTFGAWSATITQGKALWPAKSNVMRKAFFQASALQLSMMCINGGNAIPESILADYNYLAGAVSASSYAKVSAGTIPNGYSSMLIAAAAGRVGSWIANGNHCMGEDQPAQ
jgi:hypothetical protein